MSVFTALSLASLLSYPLLASAKALPCPDCEEPPPVIVTTTEPCPHEEGCNHPHQPTPPPVIVTEHCHECDQTTTPETPQVITRTIKTCRAKPTTNLFESCAPSTMFYTAAPSTMWYTQNGTCEMLPPSTIYQSITIPGATMVSTSISTATVYQNGTAPPAQTITLPGSGSVVTITSYQYGLTPAPLIITSYESIPATCPSLEAPPTQVQTTTVYESGTPPPAQTVVLTSVQSFPAITVYQSGTPPPAQTVVLTQSVSPTTVYESGTPPPAQTVVLTTTSYESIPATCPSGEAPIQVQTTVQLQTTIEVQTTTIYESGTPPPAETVVLTSYLPGSTLPGEILVLTNYETDVSTAPGETVITTLGITYTTQLPAQTSFATQTIGTQTVVSTLSVATQTVTSVPPAVTLTSTLPAQTRVVTTTPAARTVTAHNHAGHAIGIYIYAVSVDRQKAATRALRFEARLTSVHLQHYYSNSIVLFDWSYYNEGDGHYHTRCEHENEHIDCNGDGGSHYEHLLDSYGSVESIGAPEPPLTSFLVTVTPAAQTFTRTNTPAAATATVTQPARTVTQIITSTAQAPPAYQTVTSTVTAQCNTATATSVRTITSVRTATVTDAGAPPGYYQPGTCAASTQTVTSLRTTTATVTSYAGAGPPPGYYDAGTCLPTTRTVTQTLGTAPAVRPTASVCNTPTGRFRISIQNFGAAYLTSTAGGAAPNSDHQTLGLTSDATQAVLFGAQGNGQATLVTTGGLTLFSDQDGGSAGNGPVFFDAPSQGGYADNQAVQFCLQPDNTFLVQNPIDGATDLRMCGGVVYLFTGANGARSGCTPITLQRS